MKRVYQVEEVTVLMDVNNNIITSILCINGNIDAMSGEKFSEVRTRFIPDYYVSGEDLYDQIEEAYFLSDNVSDYKSLIENYVYTVI